MDEFITRVWKEGSLHHRDLPWRDLDDPYLVLVSEVMLQQTQVSRVLGRWQDWLDTFPTLDSLAAAPQALVLEKWQGMGYNRRALNLKRAADRCLDAFSGRIPRSREDLLSLPGVGPATAAGVRVFAFQEPEVYLETNVRTVFLHEFFPGVDQVPDRELIPLVQASCPMDDPRAWYYALLDYGAYLKSILPNPSRRSRHYSKQSPFQGSRRQKRAFLLRYLISHPGSAAQELTEALNEVEMAAGRGPCKNGEVEGILADLQSEGFIDCGSEGWSLV